MISTDPAAAALIKTLQAQLAAAQQRISALEAQTGAPAAAASPEPAAAKGVQFDATAGEATSGMVRNQSFTSGEYAMMLTPAETKEKESGAGAETAAAARAVAFSPSAAGGEGDAQKPLNRMRSYDTLQYAADMGKTTRKVPALGRALGFPLSQKQTQSRPNSTQTYTKWANTTLLHNVIQNFASQLSLHRSQCL